MKPCRKTSAHPCLLGAHQHTHHGRAWAALDAVSAAVRWVLFALALIAAVLGIWSLVAVFAFGQAGYL